MEIKDVRALLEQLNQNEIEFDPHFYKRSAERPINEGMVRKFLSNLNSLVKIEIGNGTNRFKLWFKMSRRYSLVIIIEISSAKVLKVISAWNTNEKWQDKLKQ